MSEFKGTKGNWEVFKYNQVISFRKTVADCENDTMLPNEQHANAQLIACAPEMLLALKEVVESFEQYDGATVSVKEIKELIIKATTI